MTFRPINMKTWPRRQTYRFFTRFYRCAYTVTVHIDVTRLKAELKNKEASFSEAILWVIMHGLNSQENFRIGTNWLGRLGVYDHVSPILPLFQPKTEALTFVVAEYAKDFSVFRRGLQEICSRYRDDPRVLPMGLPPRHVICYSMESYFPFSSFGFDAYHVAGYRHTRFRPPAVTVGRYEEKDGRLMLPVALQVSHCVCDAYHCQKLFAHIQQLCDSSGAWLV